MYMNETATVDGLHRIAQEDLKKRDYSKIAFCDFVLWNFDHRNLAFVSAKFLFYWAKWNV